MKTCFELGKKDFIISTKCRIKAQSSATGVCPALFRHQKLLKKVVTNMMEYFEIHISQKNMSKETLN